MEFTIQHDEEQRQFFIMIDQQKAFVEYIQPGKRIIFTHTEVPPPLEGQGIASRLAKHALEYAKAQSFKVMPLCPYVAAYIRKHPEYKPLVLEGFNI